MRRSSPPCGPTASRAPSRTGTSCTAGPTRITEAPPQPTRPQSGKRTPLSPRSSKRAAWSVERTVAAAGRGPPPPPWGSRPLPTATPPPRPDVAASSLTRNLQRPRRGPFRSPNSLLPSASATPASRRPRAPGLAAGPSGRCVPSPRHRPHPRSIAPHAVRTTALLAPWPVEEAVDCKNHAPRWGSSSRPTSRPPTPSRPPPLLPHGDPPPAPRCRSRSPGPHPPRLPGPEAPRSSLRPSRVDVLLLSLLCCPYPPTTTFTRPAASMSHPHIPGQGISRVPRRSSCIPPTWPRRSPPPPPNAPKPPPRRTSNHALSPHLAVFAPAAIQALNILPTIGASPSRSQPK
jgi:hypothetical protein